MSQPNPNSPDHRSEPRLPASDDASTQTVLVTGASGTVGREVVRGLLERGVRVRALTREPLGADIDPRAEVVQGDLTDPASLTTALSGVDAVHLIGFDADRGAGGGPALPNPGELLTALRRAGVRRITVLQNGFPGPLEEALPDSGLEWTLLMPVEFMSNARAWTEPVRTADRVEAAYVERPSAMVHEADIGDVAAVALTEAGHDGRSYAITGPEVITVGDKVRILSEAIGRSVALVELTPEQFEADLVAAGMDEDTIAFMHEVYGNTPEVGRTVSDVVPKVTGHPARTFAQWAATHADEFR